MVHRPHIPFVFLMPLILLWLQLSTVTVRAVNNPPEITCIEVQADGSVIINWTVDANALQQYIYYSINDTLHFSLLGSIPVPGLDYHHIGVDVNTTNLYYYIEVVYPPGETVRSNIVRPMQLAVEEKSGNSGIVVLSWNEMNSGSQTYQIWQNYPVGGIWTKIADVTQTLFNHTLPNNFCDDTIDYRILVDNSPGCNSVSSVAGGRFSETQQPEPPLFDSISVNAADEVVLSWTPSISTDVRSTIIYRNDLPIATIPVTDPVHIFVDVGVDPCNNSNLVYELAAEDQCGLKSPKADESKLSPVFLNNPVGNTCEASVSLHWNPYMNAVPPLEGYQILFSVAGSPFALAGEVDANTTTFTHEQVQLGTDYTYAIRAKFGSGTSTSCQKAVTTGSYIVPAFLYLANASVLPSDKVEITVDVDLMPPSCNWEVWRSDGSGNMEIIKEIDRGEVSLNPLVTIDETSDGNLQFYQYQVVAVDGCGHDQIISNPMTTIWLSGEAFPNEVNHLQWTAFSGFDAGVSQYRIFRSIDGTIPLLPFDSVAPNVLGIFEYTDQLIGSLTETGISIYWIEAQENTGNSYGYLERSLSNRIKFVRDTELYMPNAFRPGGVTPIFKPVFLFFNGQFYLFQVYNRWGQLIFESNNHDDGWDGTYQGSVVTTGTYLYRLVYQNHIGQQTEKRGAFTVVN